MAPESRPPIAARLSSESARSFAQRVARVADDRIAVSEAGDLDIHLREPSEG
jgi:hypothetical protein